MSADDTDEKGLLPDAGLLVALSANGRRLWQVEEDQLGMAHGAVGGRSLGRRSVPAFIAEAATNHHHPHQAEA